VALVTDGRFSGATRGACVGHVSPEAAEGGVIGLVQDGDAITIDVEARALTLDVPDVELARRREGFRPLKRAVGSSWLRRYAHLVTNAASGAVMRTDL
jgi:dihydroxy-acid dehydratase